MCLLYWSSLVHGINIFWFLVHLLQDCCLLQPFRMKIAYFNPPYPSLPDVPLVLEQPGAQNQHFLISGASAPRLLCLLQPFRMKIAYFNPPYPSLPDVPLVLEQPSAQNQHFLISGASAARLLCLLQPFCMKIAHFNPPYPSLPDVPLVLEQLLCLLQPFCMKIAHFNPPYPSLPDVPVVEKPRAQNQHFLVSRASDAKLLLLLQPFCMKIAHFNPPYPSLPNMCLLHCRVLRHLCRLNRRIGIVYLAWQRDISDMALVVLRAHAQKELVSLASPSGGTTIGFMTYIAPLQTAFYAWYWN